MAIVAAAVDSLVKEYLVFRGFTTTLKSFENDIRTDRNKSFKVECILEQFSSYIQAYDIVALKSYWRYFDKCYFCHLGPDTYKIIKRLETCVLRLYVVHALQTNKLDKVTEFFEKYVIELQHEESWKDWFDMPTYCMTLFWHCKRRSSYAKELKLKATVANVLWKSLVPSSVTQQFLLFRCAALYEEPRAKQIILDLLHKDMARIGYAVIGQLFKYNFDTYVALPALLNFEKERINVTNLSDERINLKEKIELLQNELVRFRSEGDLGKVDCATQTDENNKDGLESNKGRRKSPLAKPRFGWKLLGSKEKEVKSSPQKENDNSASETSELHLHSSLDETALRRHKSFSNTIPSRTQENPPLSSKGKDASSTSSLSSFPNDDVNFGSTFYAALEEKTTQNEEWKTFNKSISNPEDTHSKSKTSSYYAENITETPFIILSQDEFKEHTSPIVSCKFSDNTNLVSSLDLDGIVKVWQCYPTVAHSSTVSLKSDILSFDWIPKAESKLLLGKANGQLALYDINLRKAIWEASVNHRYKRIVSVVCNPVAASGVCSAATSQLLENKRNSSYGNNKSQKLIKMKEYTSFNSSSASKAGNLTVWDLQTGQQKNELCLDPFPVCIHSLSYNHNGTLLVTGGADGMVRLFDIRNSDCLIGWHAHSTNVLDVMFDPDETSIYSIGTDGMVCVWDINKVSSKIAEFPLHEGSTGINHYSKSRDLGVSNVDDLPCGKLLDCDSDGKHIMTCGPSGLMIYQVNPRTEMNEVMHILSPSSEVVTLDWMSSPNCSTAMCGTLTGAIHVSTLLRR